MQHFEQIQGSAHAQFEHPVLLHCKKVAADLISVRCHHLIPKTTSTFLLVFHLFLYSYLVFTCCRIFLLLWFKQNVDPWNPAVISGMRGLSPLNLAALSFWRLPRYRWGLNNCTVALFVFCGRAVAVWARWILFKNKPGGVRHVSNLSHFSAACNFHRGSLSSAAHISTQNSISCLYAAG